MIGRIANWEDDAMGRVPHPFNYDMTVWRPGKKGKGMVSPEGKAYAWETTEEHDGTPSHGEALGVVNQTGGDEDENAGAGMKNGWSFYDIYHDGTSRHLFGPPEHKAIMKAHLPQEDRCSGCGEPVEPDGTGIYNCANCRWQGQSEMPDEEEWGSMFSATMSDGGPSFEWYDQGELDPGRGKDYQGDHSFFYHPRTDTVHIGTSSMHHANIHDQARANGVEGDLHAGWSFDGQFGSHLAPEQHERLYKVFNRMHINTLGERLDNDNENSWHDTFGKVAINAGPDEATWDPDDMTEEQEMAEYDIRDPYANFDHSAPIRKVHFDPERQHSEPDLYGESPSDDARLLKEFKDYEEPDAPMVFDGKRFYQGPANAYHWEMIQHDPDLRKQFDMGQYMQKNPLNAADPESRKGMAYGRFNPATETTSWYHKGRFHPERFDQLVNEQYGNPYDKSEDMGMPDNATQWQNLFSKVYADSHNAPQHNLGWGPGWPGKGIYHNGELTTWGINSTKHFMGWPHHGHMWTQKYGGDVVGAMKGENPAFLFNIEPEGTFREAHPFRGDYEGTAEQVKQIEPRLRREGDPSWDKMF